MTMMKTRALLTNPAIRTQTSSAHLSHWRGQAVQATPPHVGWELETSVVTLATPTPLMWVGPNVVVTRLFF